MRLLVRFCMTTGVRLMNALRLTWAQVDYEAGVIAFRTKSKRPGGERHVIPITREIRILLANERGKHPIYVYTYVCRRNRGKRRKGQRYPFSKNDWRKDWKAALSAAGIKDFRFHDLRHTAATRLLRATGNLAVVQRVLGHSSPTMTLRYAHVEVDDMRAAMEAAARHTAATQATETDERINETKDVV